MAKSLEPRASPATRLGCYAQQAVAVAKKARKHHQNLAGTGFYANKLAELRIAATNAFTELQSGSAGDTSALAELIGSVFSPDISRQTRVVAERELAFALRTTWAGSTNVAPAVVGDPVFPAEILKETERAELIILGRQMNGCFEQGYFDACAVMMRRLFEISVIEAFEAKSIAHKIKNADGDYFQLSALVGKALVESSFKLSRNTKRALPRLRDVGHLSAHGRSYFARKTDLENIKGDFRVAMEEFLRLSGLL